MGLEGPVVKSIRFRDDELHLVEHVESRGKFATYIKQLIIADVEKKRLDREGLSPALMEQVKELIRAELENYELGSKEALKPEVRKEDLADLGEFGIRKR